MPRKLTRTLNSLIVKNIATFLVILLLVVLPLVYVYLKDVERLVSDRISVQLEMVAELGNFLLDAEEVELIRNPIWYGTHEYRRLIATLQELQRNFGIDNAVVYRRTADGGFVYVADDKRQFEINEPVGLHRQFPGTYTAANTAWETRRVDNTRLFQSGDSKWFQVNMPLLDANGQPVAVLMLNKFATPIAVAIAERQGNILVGMSIALAGGIAVWWFLTARRLRPLVRLTDATREIAGGNLALEVPPIRSHSEIGQLYDSFVKMVDDLRASRAEIEEYNRTLERRIAERTREIRDLLDNMDEGIFSIDAEGTIASGYSEATERMLGPIEGEANLFDRLLVEPEQRTLMTQTFGLLLSGNLMLAWEDMVTNLPTEFATADDRWLKAHYRPVHGDDGTPERVMIVLADITREKALQQDIDTSRSLQEMVVRILQNRESYELFHEDALALLGEAERQVRGLETARRGVVDEVFRTMHTIKGTAAVFGMDDAAGLAHTAEDQLRELGEHRDRPLDETERETLLAGLHSVRDALVDNRLRFLEVIGEEEIEPTYHIPASKLARVTSEVLEQVPPQAAERIRTALTRLQWVPTARLLRKYRTMVEQLGERLGKPVVFALREKSPTELPPAFFKQLDGTFLHILRNAVDHGLEDPEVRMEAGKPGEATIAISAEYRGEGLLFSIADDGGGIDLERIRRVAVERGVMSEAEAAGADREALLRLLFLPRFSSRSEVSDLSGRGVGLDVVRHDVEAMGGRMKLTTHRGQGTTFQLYYPLPA